MRALSVLDEAVDETRRSHILTPSAGLRFALAYLWSISRAQDRSSFDAFWYYVQGFDVPGPTPDIRETMRPTYSRTAFCIISRSVGMEYTPALSDAMMALRSPKKTSGCRPRPSAASRRRVDSGS